MTFLRTFAALLALPLLLAACPQLPQPFQHDAANPLLELDGRGGIFLDFEPGAPPALAPAVKAALMKQEIPVFLAHPPSEAYRLGLKIRKGQERAGMAELELFWELRDQDGLTIGHHDQRMRTIAGDWEAGKPSLMKRLADEAAGPLAALMPIEEGTNPSQSATADAILVFIPPVEGAPGDGNDSLARAMRLALLANGLKVQDRPSGDAFSLKGQVKVGRSDPKGDQLRLEWILQDPKGGEMAAFEQQGMVAKGQLDRPWGTLAAEIVAGTAIELSGLLKDAKR